MRVSADHKSGVVFPSHANTFNESFIQEEKGAITLSASMFNQGIKKKYLVFTFFCNVNVFFDLLNKCILFFLTEN